MNIVMENWWQGLGVLLFAGLLGTMIFNIMFEVETVEVEQ